MLQLLLTVVAASAAASVAPQPILLLESYVDKRPPELELYLPALVKQLREDQVIATGELASLIERRHSKSAEGDAAAVDAAVLETSQGIDLFQGGKVEEAREKLSHAESVLAAAASIVARDLHVRAALGRARIVLAKVHFWLKDDPAAQEQMQEVIRSSGRHEPSVREHGQVILDFYRKVRRQMDQQQRGSLRVESQPKACSVFVDEEYIGIAPVSLTDLYPGRYRVLLQCGGQPSRLHEVAVVGGDQRLEIDFALDQALRSGPDGPALAFASTQERESHERRAITQLSRHLGAKTALLVSIQRYQGTPSLVGTTIDIDSGHELRQAMLALQPIAPSLSALRALARFLVAGEPNSELIIPSQPVAHPSAARPWKWVSLGVGLAALATGIVLLAIDGRPTCDLPPGVLCNERLATGGLGLALTAVGGVSLGLSGFLFWLDARPGAAPAPSARAQNLGVQVSFRF